jgi:phosphoglycerol transferase MdoB-like AlkP superfamily enzyme
MGMIDVLPTVGNMLGIDPVYALGTDIFEIKNDNIVVFPNGNFLTDKVYYYSSKGDYRLLNNTTGNLTLDGNYISDRIKYTEDILQVSNNIIVYDLIKEQRERSGTNGEQKN